MRSMFDDLLYVSNDSYGHADNEGVDEALKPLQIFRPLEIMMLGFNDDDKTGHFWEGHNWSFERQELANPPMGVQIIRQY